MYLQTIPALIRCNCGSTFLCGHQILLFGEQLHVLELINLWIDSPKNAEELDPD